MCIVDKEKNYCVRSFTLFSVTLWGYLTKRGTVIINIGTVRTLSSLTNAEAGICCALCRGKKGPNCEYPVF